MLIEIQACDVIAKRKSGTMDCRAIILTKSGSDAPKAASKFNRACNMRRMAFTMIVRILFVSKG